MAKNLTLRALTRPEQRVLAAKLKDLSLSARIYPRYRVIEEVRQGRAMTEAADRVGCHFTVAYDWVHRFNEDRKSTRLNSSHLVISYAVFCLKKKTVLYPYP